MNHLEQDWPLIAFRVKVGEQAYGVHWLVLSDESVSLVGFVRLNTRHLEITPPARTVLYDCMSSPLTDDRKVTFTFSP